jgi:Leucine-rich repeat (LRR) protein
LRHLRELKADNNRITDLSGIGEMDCLIKLSLAGNRIESLDLGLVKWCVQIARYLQRLTRRDRQKLEYLNVSNNQLTSMSDLHNLVAVTSINLGTPVVSCFSQS